VGTRSATRYGLGVASELGTALAEAGISVVSGLALGIDGAAHEGALGGADAERAVAPPVAVVAGSLSDPYPQRHARLWRRVAHAGAVISEAPIGAADLTWRFPQRNRIIAAVSEVVVVVECHTSGGSLHTVAAAVRRSIPVTAVPGSIRSPASAGTNGLLADGCAVIRDVTDVLVALGLRRVGSVRPTEPQSLPLLDPTAAAVLDALGWERCTVEVLLTRTGLAVDACAAALERLAQLGALVGSGGWWERV
jgi:DNA processing protein